MRFARLHGHLHRWSVRMGNELSLPTQPYRTPDLPTVKLIRPLNIEKTETFASPAHETAYIVADKVGHIMEAPCTAASATSKVYDASKTPPQELSSEVLQSIREY